MIFGLGSGRCGTRSLSRILNLPHETTLLPWQFHAERFDLAVEHVAKVGGNVSMTWLPYTEAVWERYPQARFVCLQRDKEATCRSWLKRLVGKKHLDLNCLWFDDDRSLHAGSMFPDYGNEAIETAIGRFYDEYYERAQKLADENPVRFRIYPSPDVLTGPILQSEMLDFCGSLRPVNVEVNENSHGEQSRVELSNRLLDYCGTIIKNRLPDGGYEGKVMVDEEEIEALRGLVAKVHHVDPSKYKKIDVLLKVNNVGAHSLSAEPRLMGER